MDWITPDDFKTTFVDAKQATEKQSQLAIDAAEDEVVGLIGQAAVDDVKSVSPSDPVRAAKVVRAHSYFAIANHLPNAKVLKSQQDTASPATGGANITNTWFSPKELELRAAEWRTKARAALSAYIIGDEPDEPGYVEIKHYSSSVPIEIGW